MSNSRVFDFGDGIQFPDGQIHPLQFPQVPEYGPRLFSGHDEEYVVIEDILVKTPVIKRLANPFGEGAFGQLWWRPFLPDEVLQKEESHRLLGLLSAMCAERLKPSPVGEQEPLDGIRFTTGVYSIASILNAPEILLAMAAEHPACLDAFASLDWRDEEGYPCDIESLIPEFIIAFRDVPLPFRSQIAQSYQAIESLQKAFAEAALPELASTLVTEARSLARVSEGAIEGLLQAEREDGESLLAQQIRDLHEGPILAAINDAEEGTIGEKAFLELYFEQFFAALDQSLRPENVSQVIGLLQQAPALADRKFDALAETLEALNALTI